MAENIIISGVLPKTKAKNNDEDIVTIMLYGSTVKKKRSEAIDEYMKATVACDGAEALRYKTILACLLNGDTEIDSDADNFGW